MDSNNVASFSVQVMLPMLSLLFFFESFRLFVASIYYSNLATLSFNITFSFLFLAFFTLISPYLFPSKSPLLIIVIITILLAIFRFLMVFTIPNIFAEPNSTPTLHLPIIFSGLALVLSLILYAKLVHANIATSGKNTAEYSREMTVVFISAIVFDNIILQLGSSLDLSVSSTLIGYIISILLLIIFLVSTIIALPILKVFKPPNESKVVASIILSKKKQFSLTIALGLIFLFELAFLGSPFIFITWTAEEPTSNAFIYSIMLSIILLIYSFPRIRINLLENKTTLVFANLLLLIFLAEIGFMHTYFSYLSNRLNNVIIDLSMFQSLLLPILAGCAQFAVITNAYWIFKQLVQTNWHSVQWIFGGSVVILVLTTLLLALTYVYSVLPRAIHIFFKGYILPFSFIFALILIYFIFQSRKSLEVHT